MRTPPSPPCAVCRRPARGFRWSDPLRAKTPRPPASFCSMPCQGIWTRLARRSPAVVDLTEQERAAIRAAMRPLGEYLGEIGWSTRVQDMTETQVLTLVEVVVGGFQDAMQALARSEARLEEPF